MLPPPRRRGPSPRPSLTRPSAAPPGRTRGRLLLQAGRAAGAACLPPPTACARNATDGLLLDQAGYLHIDCAPLYKNEKEIGFALNKLFNDGVIKREDLFITSKIWCSDLAPEDVPLAIGSTLSDLQLDYLDLYLILWPLQIKKGGEISPENFVQIGMPKTWQAMEELYHSGKARALGVSNFSTKKLADLLALARVPPAVDQVECHPGWQQAKLRAFFHTNGVHFSAYAPLGRMKAIANNPVVASIDERLGKTSTRIALRWGLQQGQSVLSKSANESRLKENVDLFGWSIPEELCAKFSEIE